MELFILVGMCDFQYLPWEELPDGRKVSVFNHVALWNFRQYEDFSESEPERLFLPPPFFSRFENPTVSGNEIEMLSLSSYSIYSVHF